MSMFAGFETNLAGKQVNANSSCSNLAFETTNAQNTQQRKRIGSNNRKRSSTTTTLYFLIMRLNLKALFLFIIFAVCITFFVYTRCADRLSPQEFFKRWDGSLYTFGGGSSSSKNQLLGDYAKNELTALENIECVINQELSIQCKHDAIENEVYVPFTFLRRYFDVSGVFSNANTNTNAENVQNVKFNWMHSTAKVNYPKDKYNPHGIFMYFENYNVETRDRVKCISAAEGVPVSMQWEKRGYFYPTQIAQFALTHYSRNMSEAEPEPKIHVLEDADGNKMSWLKPKNSNLTRIWHPKFNTSILQYETEIDYESAVQLPLNQTMTELVLSLDVLLVTNSSSLMVSLQHMETKRIYRLHYIPADLMLSVQEQNIYYGMGSLALNKWRHLTRDLNIDVQKGIATDKKSGIKLKRGKLQVLSLSFLGTGFFDNITLSTSAHLAHFYDAAEWLINNQDVKTGGWPIAVRRNLNGFVELKAGKWLSAMAQGHAISVLARAYWHSGGDKRFLKAAALGLKPYHVLSKHGGVLAQFMDKFDWYEEYPTTPPSFVLNGFIYSLFGLYDLNVTAPVSIAREAGKLFAKGMYSLKNMLLLYDTGSGTSYDLRHLSLGVAPNLARWDYHATHVSQLLLLATIDGDPLISHTAERWRSYMLGHRAKHN